jgi:hypothetical protein
MTTIPKPGDTVWAPMHDTTGATVTAAVVALDVVKLGCGCHRIHAERPGPDEGPIGRAVNLLTGQCGLHPCHLVANPNA